jgi:hypothetical protein
MAESMVAVLLFALTAAAVGQLLTQQVRFEGTNGTMTTAIALAEAEMEDLRSLAYASIVSRSSQTVVGSITYNLQTTVASDTPAVNMKSITTNVTWTEPSGSQSYALYSIYTAVTR